MTSEPTALRMLLTSIDHNWQRGIEAEYIEMGDREYRQFAPYADRGCIYTGVPVPPGTLFDGVPVRRVEAPSHLYVRYKEQP